MRYGVYVNEELITVHKNLIDAQNAVKRIISLKLKDVTEVYIDLIP